MIARGLRAIFNGVLDVVHTCPIYEFFYPYNPATGRNERMSA